MSSLSVGPERFGLTSATAPAPSASATGLNALPTPAAGAANITKPWSPDSPMFAFGVLAALTFGLMAFSTSGTVRVGKTKLTGAVGVGSTS
jgi:hypothetical protein